MELYNLEKKSDSTRGRKSLDMKHDPTAPAALLNGLGGGGGGKTSSEKISSLVQQMEQQKMMQRNAVNSLFGANLSPFGANLPRHLLPPGSPLMGGIGSLLGGPPMFSLNNLPKTPGMAGSLFPGLQPGLATSLLQAQPAVTTGVSTTSVPGHAVVSEAGKLYQGIKLPLKVESSPEKTDMQRAYETSESRTLSPRIQHVQPHRAGDETKMEDDNQPQDLTLPVKQSPPPPRLTQKGRSESTDSNEMYTYSSVVRAEDCSSVVDSPMSGTYAEDSDAAPTPPPPIANWEKTTSEMNRKITEKLLSRVSAAGGCGNGDCTHAQKLQDLRKNIVRILNVLTPDMSIEDGLDYRTDQVDQLLYDVIYCSMDEIERGSKGCRESSCKT